MLSKKHRMKGSAYLGSLLSRQEGAVRGVDVRALPVPTLIIASTGSGKATWQACCSKR
jgi:hypothetical protein